MIGDLADHTTAAGWLAERLREPRERGAVLLHAPAAAFQAPGGGEVQLLQTARHLVERGLPVRPFCPWTDRIEHARLLHLFGMSPGGLALARVAKERRVPVVVSPICWFEPRALRALASGPWQAAGHLARYALRRAWPAGFGWRADLLRLADRVLPNSRAEADQLRRLFGVEARRISVVPNGVDGRFAGADPRPFREASGVAGDFVLYVGRIEPRKNVLGLVRAVREAGLRLVAVGDAVPGHEGYRRACVEAGGDRVRWWPRMDHDDPRLASAYAAARAFALPSWFETPGLAALEAASAGCAVVITPFGCTREYFGDEAAYARPDRPREIAERLRQAWSNPAPEGLARRIAAQYGWREVARRTAEAYDLVAA